MGFALKVETRKLPALIKRLDKLNGTEIEVGFFEYDKYGTENGNLYVAQVAAFNEFGTETVPQRPFMTETFEGFANQLHMARGMKTVFQNVLLNGRQVVQLLKNLGRTTADIMQISIEDYPGSNSPSTIARKGKNDPLYDTGKMLESVKFKIH